MILYQICVFGSDLKSKKATSIGDSFNFDLTIYKYSLKLIEQILYTKAHWTVINNVGEFFGQSEIQDGCHSKTKLYHELYGKIFKHCFLRNYWTN